MARTTPIDTVRELQRTLYRAAKADPGRRFHALYDKLARSDVLERAWGAPKDLPAVIAAREGATWLLDAAAAAELTQATRSGI